MKYSVYPHICYSMIVELDHHVNHYKMTVRNNLKENLHKISTITINDSNQTNLFFSIHLMQQKNGKYLSQITYISIYYKS